jgi:membrane protease YdiL (CAAX protease family)
VIASSVLFAWLFNRSQGSVVPVLVLHTAVNAWLMIVPVTVLPDGSNLRLSQFVVGILVLTAVALLVGGERSPDQPLDPE